MVCKSKIKYLGPRVYDYCCRSVRIFHAMLRRSLPPLVLGKEAYYCCWGFFPLGFVIGIHDGGGKGAVTSGCPNWMPPVFSGGQQDGGKLVQWRTGLGRSQSYSGE